MIFVTWRGFFPRAGIDRELKMSDRLPPLYPWPLDRLLDRIAHEWTTRGEIFSLPGRRFFRPGVDPDLTLDLGENRVASPVGPAAGPHTQLAQNIVLAWLAGGRSYELKTVQILDELDIERPCIDMENVGYNIEWSQELTLEQSLVEYVKAAYLLEILGRWQPLVEIMKDPGGHLFELSVGYDLDGIQSDRMTALIHGLRDTEAVLQNLRPQVPEAFAHLRDVPVPRCLVQTATLSTFHGCPPDEIEGIVQHLMTVHGLDVTVKLNPTLLGMDDVKAILQDRLGYHDVTLVPEAFAEDLKLDRALAMIDRLEKFAAGCGRTFGLKLTNTLVVANTRGVMPGERMYLSGRPLHVLAVELLARLDGLLPGRLKLGPSSEGIPVAFSAGIDKDNLADTVGLGLAPVTICSDLLKPGGYSRMAQGLKKLGKTMRDAGCADRQAWLAHCHTEAQTGGHSNAVQALARRHEEAEGCRRYTRQATEKPLRQVDHALQVFDCVACTNCVTVCPNNAFLAVPSSGVEGLEARQQYLLLAELCNACGNCTTFCPEKGAPHLIKPALFTEWKAWQDQQGRGFHLSRDSEGALWVGGDPTAAAILCELLEGEKGWPLPEDRLAE